MNAPAAPSRRRRPPIDVLLIGGGVAGLWALDVLTSRGLSCLLAEAGELGRGQTVASQGIVHGGLKYTLVRPADRQRQEHPRDARPLAPLRRGHAGPAVP